MPPSPCVSACLTLSTPAFLSEDAFTLVCHAEDHSLVTATSIQAFPCSAPASTSTHAASLVTATLTRALYPFSPIGPSTAASHVDVRSLCARPVLQRPPTTAWSAH